MDAFDRKILRVLASEGRLAAVDVAARVGLSASAVTRRLQNLEATGAIRAKRSEYVRRLGTSPYNVETLSYEQKADRLVSIHTRPAKQRDGR